MRPLDSEGRTGPMVTFDGERSAHHRHQPTTERQTESNSRSGRCAVTATFEWFEDPFMIRRRDSTTGVGNLDADRMPCVVVDGHSDRTVAGEFDRITEEISEHATQGLWIKADRSGNVGSNVVLELDTTFCGRSMKEPHGICDHLSEVALLRNDRIGAGIHASALKHTIEEVQKVYAIAFDHLDGGSPTVV